MRAMTGTADFAVRFVVPAAQALPNAARSMARRRSTISSVAHPGPRVVQAQLDAHTAVQPSRPPAWAGNGKRVHATKSGSHTDVFWHAEPRKCRGFLWPRWCYYGGQDLPGQVFHTGIHPPREVDVSGLSEADFLVAVRDHASDAQGEVYALRMGRQLFFGGGAVSTSADMDQTLEFATKWPVDGVFPNRPGYVYKIDTRLALQHFDQIGQRYANSNREGATDHRDESEMQWWDPIPAHCIVEAYEVKACSTELTGRVLRNPEYNDNEQRASGSTG
jgi:hypothetical protein